MFQASISNIAVLKLVLLVGIDPTYVGYQPTILPLNYRRIKIGRADGCCPHSISRSTGECQCCLTSALFWNFLIYLMFGWNHVHPFKMQHPSPGWFLRDSPQSHFTFIGISFVVTGIRFILKLATQDGYAPSSSRWKRGDLLLIYRVIWNWLLLFKFDLASPPRVEPGIQPWKSCVITYRSLQGHLNFTIKDHCCFLLTIIL